MKHTVIIGFLFLAACAPLTERSQPQTPPIQPTPAQPIDIPLDTETSEPAITVEPFEEPLTPISLTGSITVEERVLPGGILEIGAPNAPHTMTIFLHPESPYSQEFQRSRMPLLLSQFVNQGQMKMHLFILPIKKYAGSAFAARAVHCTAAQGKGYPAFGTLFHQEITDLTDHDLSALGIDTAAYTACIRDGTNDPFAASAQAAEAWNITLVPSYVLKNTVAVGLPLEADLIEAVKAALR